MVEAVPIDDDPSFEKFSLEDSIQIRNINRPRITPTPFDFCARKKLIYFQKQVQMKNKKNEIIPFTPEVRGWHTFGAAVY